MSTLRRSVGVSLLLMVVTALAGCGGSGSGSGGGTPAEAGRLGVYVGAEPGGAYGQVWATLYRVEVSTDGTEWRTVYDNPDGATVNLASLTSVAQFVGASNLPAGTYTKARITVGDTLHVLSNGSTMDIPLDTSGGTTAGGHFTFVTGIAAQVPSGGAGDAFLDFDLPHFQLMGNHLRIGMRMMDHARFMGMRKHGVLEGTVTNLTATGFDLAMAHGLRAIPVQVTDTTSIFDEGTGANATLANGQEVEVQGTVDPTTFVVVAETIAVEVSEPNPPGGLRRVTVQGTVATLDDAAKSFTLAPTWTKHFQPSAATITVQTNAATLFRARGHQQAAWSDVGTGDRVLVSGVYNSGTGILLAQRVMFLP